MSQTSSKVSTNQNFFSPQLEKKYRNKIVGRLKAKGLRAPKDLVDERLAEALAISKKYNIDPINLRKVLSIAEYEQSSHLNGQNVSNSRALGFGKNHISKYSFYNRAISLGHDHALRVSCERYGIIFPLEYKHREILRTNDQARIATIYLMQEMLTSKMAKILITIDLNENNPQTRQGSNNLAFSPYDQKKELIVRVVNNFLAKRKITERFPTWDDVKVSYLRENPSSSELVDHDLFAQLLAALPEPDYNRVKSLLEITLGTKSTDDITQRASEYKNKYHESAIDEAWYRQQVRTKKNQKELVEELRSDTFSTEVILAKASALGNLSESKKLEIQEMLNRGHIVRFVRGNNRNGGLLQHITIYPSRNNRLAIEQRITHPNGIVVINLPLSNESFPLQGGGYNQTLEIYKKILLKPEGGIRYDQREALLHQS